MRLRSLLLACLLSCVPIASTAATPEDAARRLQSFLDGIPGLGPGYAVVVVTPDRTVLRYARGESRAGSGRTVDMDTPFYIASQTKAYVGLLASMLDEKGILDLDSTLASHWPALAVPGTLDPTRWTLRQLLTHQVPIECDEITFLSAYVAEPPVDDVPALLARHARPRDPGFRYRNLGYNLYAAILEKKTGKSWKQWLDEEILDPLALAHTSARTSDFPSDALAWNHAWLGDGWHATRPKPDAIMQSAGGMVASPGDMATWLQLQLRGRGAEGTGVTATSVEQAQAIQVALDPTTPSAYELPCHGYALGWNVCRFKQYVLHVHGGAYPGARSVMAFSRELGVGIGVFSNSDSMTGWFTTRTMVQYLQYLIDDPDAERMAGKRRTLYPERVVAQLEKQRAQRSEVRAQPQWKGWRWQPDGRALGAYAGRYLEQGSRLQATIAPAASGLSFDMGAWRMSLEPASPDLFGGTRMPLDAPEPVVFERNAAGEATGFTWSERRFARMPD